MAAYALPVQGLQQDDQLKDDVGDVPVDRCNGLTKGSRWTLLDHTRSMTREQTDLAGLAAQTETKKRACHPVYTIEKAVPPR